MTVLDKEKSDVDKTLRADSMLSIIDIAKTWGIFAALTIVFVWQSDVREKAMNTRLDAQRAFIEGQMMTLIRENTQVLKGATIAIQEVARIANWNRETLNRLNNVLPEDRDLDRINEAEAPE